ncbi:MAG: hypothetical protein GY759_07440 [Chloroflexi bacterium]|nr:hypothetical protein [Chloroflexota bacterium]
MSRVLLIGLDGATFDIIRPLVTEGRLPNLARMLEQGAAGELQSSMPPITPTPTPTPTPTAWTSVFTGKNPGKHGIYNFQDIDSATYATRPVRGDGHGEKSVWQLLGEAGKTSVAIDVPYTFPPKPLNGVMITGYGAPYRRHGFHLPSEPGRNPTGSLTSGNPCGPTEAQFRAQP